MSIDVKRFSSFFNDENEKAAEKNETNIQAHEQKYY
jgi:hypothetical protein